MSLYCGIDLHANNSYVVVADLDDKVVVGQRFPNDLGGILRALEPYREDLAGVAVESTFNWYWLVDGLRQAGHTVHLVHPLAAQQYQGLKYADDRSDARWLAKMLRLGILPTGWICPPEERAVRDLLRKRMQLGRQRVACRLSLRNLLDRAETPGAMRLSFPPWTRPGTNGFLGPRRGQGREDKLTLLHALILKSGWCVISTHCNEIQSCVTHEQDTDDNLGGAPSQKKFCGRLTSHA